MGDGQPTGEGKPIQEPTGEGQPTGLSIEQLQAELEKWKAHARKHEDLWKATGAKSSDDLKELLAARDKLRELEEQGKTEAQKAADRAAAAESRAREVEQELLRLRVAARKGLTEAQAKRLVGATEQELEADADELLDSFKPSGSGEPEGGGTRRPQERLRLGAVPDGDPETTDPRKLAELFPRG